VPCPCHPSLVVDAISQENKGLRSVKAMTMSMSLLDPTYVIEARPLSETNVVVRLVCFSCRCMRSGEERSGSRQMDKHMVETG
jgi:hypothetical protein